MIRMDIQGSDEVMTKLKAVSDKSVRRSILDDFGSYLVSVASDRFETETGPDGEKWEQSYRAKEEGGQTLSKDGHLRNSITHEASADKLEVGSNRIYAAIHQFGGEIKPKAAKQLAFRIGGHLILTDSVEMPARPYLGFTDADEVELNNIIHAHWKGTIQ